MRAVFLKKGDEVTFDEGYLIIKGFNGSIFDTEEHIIIDDDTEEIGDRRLTAEEISYMVIAVNGIYCERVSGRMMDFSDTYN